MAVQTHDEDGFRSSKKTVLIKAAVIVGIVALILTVWFFVAKTSFSKPAAETEIVATVTDYFGEEYLVSKVISEQETKRLYDIIDKYNYYKISYGKEAISFPGDPRKIYGIRYFDEGKLEQLMCDETGVVGIDNNVNVGIFGQNNEEFCLEFSNEIKKIFENKS